MPPNCLLCYITDRAAFAEDEATRRRRVLDKIADAVRAGVDSIQLRERDLSTRELESLAREALGVIRAARREDRKPRTSLLVNSRTDVALAVGAEGVHLRSEDVSPQEVRRIWEAAEDPMLRTSRGAKEPLIGVSCHSAAEVRQAAADGASFAVFAPVFEKKDAPGAAATGLALLEQACREKVPVLALGGVTLENARACLEAGAAGIAAIRLFQENDVEEIVRRMHG
jgi:thiamine-phosphate pyrophosphorylase